MTTAFNLASVLRRRGEFSEAARIHCETLEVRRRVLGAEHTDTLASACNLANALVEQGKLLQAVELHRQTLEARRRVLGPEHPDTLVSQNNLGCAVGLHSESLPQEEAAARTFREALEVSTRVRGAEHPDTGVFARNLATVLRPPENTEGRRGKKRRPAPHSEMSDA